MSDNKDKDWDMVEEKDEKTLAERQSEYAKKAWATRRRKEAKKRSRTAKKAWETRKRNARIANKRKQAAKKAWQTRKKNEEKARRRSEASKKAWKSRKKKQHTQSMPVKQRSIRVEKLLESMED